MGGLVHVCKKAHSKLAEAVRGREEQSVGWGWMALEGRGTQAGRASPAPTKAGGDEEGGVKPPLQRQEIPGCLTSFRGRGDFCGGGWQRR